MEFFIPEHKNVIEYLVDKELEMSSDLKEELKKISTKNSNNCIGYYQFKIDNNYYQIFITPKIFEGLIDKEKKNKFIRLLINYYKVIKSNKIENKYISELNGNITDLSFQGNGLSQLQGGEFQSFVENKFDKALNVLDEYFRKHIRNKTRFISYNSQSINNPIDLLKNITSIDKSNVFQLKKENYNYSKIAIICEKALRYFKFFRIEHLSELNKKICFEKTTKLLNKLNKNFELNNSFTFSVNDILKNNTIKLFNKNPDLYESLLILIGLEHYNTNDRNVEIKKIENMVSIFFRPEKLYEWIVYDQLKSEYSEAIIKKDGLDTPYNTSIKFFLTKNNGEKSEYFSEPDFVIELSDKIIIVDAKWKVLKKPEDEDIAKLKRDCDVFRENKKGNLKPIESLLIYPKIDNLFFNDSNEKYSFDFDKEFKFGIKKIEAID